MNLDASRRLYGVNIEVWHSCFYLLLLLKIIIISVYKLKRIIATQMASVQARSNHKLIVSRILAALLGGYAFVWGFSSLGIAGLAALGVDFHEAETGVLMLAFLVFLCVFLWAFASTSVARVWVVLAGGGGLMTLSAWLVQQNMLS